MQRFLECLLAILAGAITSLAVLMVAAAAVTLIVYMGLWLGLGG